VLLRYFHQTEHRWAEHLAEAEELDVGVAFANASLPNVRDANRLQMASLTEQVSPADAIAMVDAFYASRGAKCLGWVMNPSSAASQTQPLMNELLGRGFEQAASDAMYLRKVHVPAPPPAMALSIIPARASFRHARELGEEASVELSIPQWPDATLLHLDDPHWDSLLALENGNAVGTIGVLAVGEIGRIENLFVRRSHRRRGIGTLLVARALEICARSLFKHVFACCNESQTSARSIYRSVGFERIGSYVEYRPPSNA
jgi:ribosomal protein S18 acetylase RimI-like enzyme